MHGLEIRLNLIDAVLADRTLLEEVLALSPPAGETPWHGGVIYREAGQSGFFLYLLDANPLGTEQDEDFPEGSAAVRGLGELCDRLRTQFDVWLWPVAAQLVESSVPEDDSDDLADTLPVRSHLWPLPHHQLSLFAGVWRDEAAWISLSRASRFGPDGR